MSSLYQNIRFHVRHGSAQTIKILIIQQQDFSLNFVHGNFLYVDKNHYFVLYSFSQHTVEVARIGDVITKNMEIIHSGRSIDFVPVFIATDRAQADKMAPLVLNMVEQSKSSFTGTRPLLIQYVQDLEKQYSND